MLRQEPFGEGDRVGEGGEARIGERNDPRGIGDREIAAAGIIAAAYRGVKSIEK